MHCYVFSIIVSKLPILNETVFDIHLEEFKKIISLTRTFLELEEEQKKALGCDLPYRNSFSFDLGILPPLWVVGSRCRGPTVRREAFRLFYLGRRREGVLGKCHDGHVSSPINLYRGRWTRRSLIGRGHTT